MLGVVVSCCACCCVTGCGVLLRIVWLAWFVLVCCVVLFDLVVSFYLLFCDASLCYGSLLGTVLFAVLVCCCVLLCVVVVSFAVVC